MTKEELVNEINRITFMVEELMDTISSETKRIIRALENLPDASDIEDSSIDVDKFVDESGE